jgi:uncharacterized SAM-binding protein YcdF (DUF218 family)
MRVTAALIYAAIANVLVFAGLGYVLAHYSRVDEPGPVDAVVVLGGEHDGREDYGIALAREFGAHTVLLSNSYAAPDRVMRRVCNKRVDGLDIICRAPDPSTTRGEAMMAAELGAQRHWRRIIVVSWRYHLPRARLIFRQCYSPDPAAVIMRPAPRLTVSGLDDLLFVFGYQSAATVSALAEGPCR